MLHDINAQHILRDQQDILKEWQERQSDNDPAKRNDKSQVGNLYDDIGLAHKKMEQNKNNADSLGDFMTLFLAQLKNQDPLDPQDGSEFVAQLAQFNTVEGIQRLNGKVADMADVFRSGKILEATSLMGKKIQVPLKNLNLETKVKEDGTTYTEKVTGIIKVPDVNENRHPGELLEITDLRFGLQCKDTGQYIVGKHYGRQVPNTEVKFEFDGNDSNGERMTDEHGQPIPDGEYRIIADMMVNGKWKPVETLVGTKVDSISINQEKGDITLNASGVGEINLKDLDRIAE